MSIETVITKKLYPTPENYQLQGDSHHPHMVASYIENLIKQVPESERGSLRLTGWNGVRIDWDHTLSVAEQKDEKLRQALVMVTASGVDGMTPEQVAELRGLLLG